MLHQPNSVTPAEALLLATITAVTVVSHRNPHYCSVETVAVIVNLKDLFKYLRRVSRRSLKAYKDLDVNIPTLESSTRQDGVLITRPESMYP